MNNASWFTQKIAALPREKADTLLLIAACSFVLIPFAEHSPIWLSLIATLLIAWRVWLTLRGQSLPRKWVLTLMSLALLSVVYWQFHTWLGKDAGIAFLIILVCLKMLELHARRDAVSVVFVCYFLLVGQLLYSQSLLSAFYLLFCTGLLISTQFTFQYHQLIPAFSTRLLSGYKIVGLAIPLALILFLFFPRIQGPLWGKQQGNLGGITGLSDSMEPGTVAELALSDQIAFRVRFVGNSGYAPKPYQLYWRGVVLDTFNGSRWSVGRLTRQPEATSPTHGIPVTQEIILEPHNQRWLFGLDRPDNLTSYNGTLVATGDNQYGKLTSYGEMRSPNPIQDRIRYTINSYLNNTIAPPATSAERLEIHNHALQLPLGYNPLTIQWAQQLRQKTTDPVQLTNLVLDFFREQPFRYTLSPPPLGVNQIDDFMFGTQAGFCEHYASAFVVIMRAMNIPARVVTGYQGGEMNSIDGLMTVRQSDAHAWAEIWLGQRGWVRVDPTAAVAPNRVEHGINSTFPNRNLTSLLSSSLLNLGQQTWIANLTNQFRARWDATNSAWNLWVLNYSLNKQINLLSSLSGIEHPQPAQLGIAMMFAASLVIATLSFILLGKRIAASPPDKVYLAFCQHMNRQGYPRMPHEGAIDYCRRLQLVFRNRPELADFLTLYANCKYGKGYNPDQLTQLKKLLTLCLQLKSSRANPTTSNEFSK